MVLLALVGFALCLTGASDDTPPSAKVEPAPRGDLWSTPADSPLVRVGMADREYDLVMAEYARIHDRYVRGGIVLPQPVGPAWRVQGPAITKLFPEHRFFLLVWNEKAKEPPRPGTPRPSGLLLLARAIVILDGRDRVQTVRNFWSVDSLAGFLSNANVKLRNQQDAQLLWDALCEIYRNDRVGRQIRISNQAWRLGVEPIRDGWCYYEVRLGSGFKIDSITLDSAREFPDGD